MSNKDVLVDLWSRVDNHGEIEAMDRLFAPDFIRHGGKGDQTLEDFKRILNGLHSGFPDLRSEVVDIVEEGDRVAYRWVSTGTHLGDYLGAPPTGRTVTASGITISRFENGRIVEDWASWNEVSVLHSIGVLPIDR
ncbi:ester cyclase [Leucobacter soli]|uniref:Ester cyclase n=1 Tax=Leucobacter soli TaxID=2812850 RepID=A0A916NH49_9MICO|nr:ester cyclase [Leucobacter soli]CAG7612014.1 hypothetical protein LEUCIP111803_01516 [Leucobacter soli]